MIVSACRPTGTPVARSATSPESRAFMDVWGWTPFGRAALARVGRMEDQGATAESASPDELVGGLLHIDLAAVKANYRQLVRAVKPAACGACIKSSAYGL